MSGFSLVSAEEYGCIAASRMKGILDTLDKNRKHWFGVKKKSLSVLELVYTSNSKWIAETKNHLKTMLSGKHEFHASYAKRVSNHEKDLEVLKDRIKTLKDPPKNDTPILVQTSKDEFQDHLDTHKRESDQAFSLADLEPIQKSDNATTSDSKNQHGDAAVSIDFVAPNQDTANESDSPHSPVAIQIEEDDTLRKSEERAHFRKKVCLFMIAAGALCVCLIVGAFLVSVLK